jgi:hypothetical protein
VSAKVQEDQRSTTNRNQNIRLDPLNGTLKDNKFEIQQNKDFGAGQIDLVCKIAIHPGLPPINCGFIILRSEQGEGDKDWQDNQFSIRKIEEAAMRGIRSGMDRVYLIVDNEEMAKSKKESKRVKNVRETLLDKHARPKSQRKKKESRR